MPTAFADGLDALLRRLRAAGATDLILIADAASLERLFRERGETAVLFDADPSQEIAWYGGDCQVVAGPPGECGLTYHLAGEGHAVGLDIDGPGPDLT